MVYYIVILLICAILHRFTIIGAETENDPESIWSTDKGNSQNTYRIVSSMATNYSKLPWTYEYNLTSQDITEFGRDAGINGDIYFFLSETRSHQGNCLFSPFYSSCTAFQSGSTCKHTIENLVTV
jgi:hypothetical protein